MNANSESLSIPTMSFEEFLELSDEDTRAEWVNEKIEFSAVLKGFSLPVNLLWTPDALLDHTF